MAINIQAQLKIGGPGAYTPESVQRTTEIVEELVKKIGASARELAINAGKKRVTEEEIKLAVKYLIK